MALPFAPPAAPYNGPPPTDNDPGIATANQDVRNAWNALTPDRFSHLCNVAYSTGDFGYVATALRSNHDELKAGHEMIAQRAHQEQRANRLTGEEGFSMFQMMAKINDLLLGLLTRHQFMEHQVVNIANQAQGTSELTEQIKKLAE